MKRPRNKRIFIVSLISVLLSLGLQVAVLEFLLLQTSGETVILPQQRKSFRATLTPRPKEKPEEPKEEMPEGTVVDVPEPEKEERPKETMHLAKHDVDVKKETKSRFRDRAKKERRKGKATTRKTSRMQSPDSDSTSPTKLTKAPAKPELPKADPVMGPTEHGDRAVPKKESRGKKPSLLLPASDEQSTLANLQTLTKQFTSDDALLDIEDESDETLLKARSFRFHDFFSRVKERVRQEWNPQRVHRQRDPTGKVYGVKDRLTILRVSLDEQGNVLKLNVHKASGVDFLDQEAARAFRTAGPFPNPPEALLDEYGHISFGVGFLYEIGNARHRFFWKRM